MVLMSDWHKLLHVFYQCHQLGTKQHLILLVRYQFLKWTSLLKLGYPNTDAVVKATFSVSKDS